MRPVAQLIEGSEAEREAAYSKLVEREVAEMVECGGFDIQETQFVILLTGGHAVIRAGSAAVELTDLLTAKLSGETPQGPSQTCGRKPYRDSYRGD